MLDCCFCCENPADLGCWVGCLLNTGETAATAGSYTLRAFFKGAIAEAVAVLEPGDPLVFDISKFNEDFVYTAEIRDPAGAVVPVAGSPCFKFRRVPTAGAVATPA